MKEVDISHIVMIIFAIFFVFLIKDLARRGKIDLFKKTEWGPFYFDLGSGLKLFCYLLVTQILSILFTICAKHRFFQGYFVLIALAILFLYFLFKEAKQTENLLVKIFTILYICVILFMIFITILGLLKTQF